MAHDNTISNREYILGGRTKEGKQFSFDKAKVLIDNLKEVLLEMELCLKVKYHKYTKYRLIKDLWEDIFDTLLLKFDECIIIRPHVFNKNNKVVGINIDHLDRVAKSISSSEKFFLSLLLQQYSCSINDRYFKFSDIPSLVSITSKSKINKILHVFSIYPHLFNGESIEDYEH